MILVDNMVETSDIDYMIRDCLEKGFDLKDFFGRLKALTKSGRGYSGIIMPYNLGQLIYIVGFEEIHETRFIPKMVEDVNDNEDTIYQLKDGYSFFQSEVDNGVYATYEDAEREKKRKKMWR